MIRASLLCLCTIGSAINFRQQLPISAAYQSPVLCLLV